MVSFCSNWKRLTIKTIIAPSRLGQNRMPATRRRELTRVLTALSMCVGLLAVAADATAQPPGAAWNQTGVDSLILKDGTRLFGLVDTQSDPPTWAFVDRQWIRAAHPDLHQELSDREADWWAQRKPELLRDIDDWINRRQDNRLLVSFLEDERNRIEAIDRESLKRTRLLSIPIDQLRRFKSRPAKQRRIAALAWQHELPDVATTRVGDLQRQLETAGVDVDATPVNLVPSLPPMPETPDSWAARVALVEFQYHEPMEFHGTRKFLWASDAAPRPELLLGPLMENSIDQLSQLGQELGLPEFRQAPAAAEQPSDDRDATAAADQRDLNGVLVIRLWDQTTQYVETRSTFYARLSNGRWSPIFRSEIRISLSEVRPEQVEAMRQNQQIGKAIESVRNLGFPIDESRLDLALRHGVATQSALAKARDSFAEFMQPHIERLDTYPVLLR